METKKERRLLPFLTFRLQGDCYALEIEKTREVLKYTKITRIPKSPEYMLGVINLRGGVVSVVDLRMKFGMGKIENVENANIIILELAHQGEPVSIGALVDSVDEVLELETTEIEGTKKLGMNMSGEFIQGIGRKNDEFLIILDIDRIFSVAELTMVSGLGRSLLEEAAASH